MVYIRIKHIKSKYGIQKHYCYTYLVKSYWDKKKDSSRQKVIKYIGKVRGLNPFIIKKIFKKDNYTCKICGSNKNLTIDHIIPYSKNGKNNEENLQTLCSKCNILKGNK